LHGFHEKGICETRAIPGVFLNSMQSVGQQDVSDVYGISWERGWTAGDSSHFKFLWMWNCNADNGPAVAEQISNHDKDIGAGRNVQHVCQLILPVVDIQGKVCR
jgi:hypothetical protein